MVATIVRPLSVSFGTATILVYVQSVFISSLPTLVLALTSIGPFVPLIASAWSSRKLTSAEDTKYVFEPLFEEIRKNRDAIRSSETWSGIPSFQTNTFDQIRNGAKYSLLKSRVPTVESFRETMEIAFTSQGDAKRAATRIVRETVGDELGVNGTTVAFRGRNKEGGSNNYEGDMWALPMLIRGRDPIQVLGKHISVESMVIMDRNGSPMGELTFPKDETKYRRFWDAAEKKAKTDPDIRKCRDAIDKLPELGENAESRVLKEIEKSRRSFAM